VLSAAALAVVVPAQGLAAPAVDSSGVWVEVDDGAAEAAAPLGLAPRLAAMAATVAPAPSGGWAVFEDWREPTIRADRWSVAAGNAQDARREVVGGHLATRYRFVALPAAANVGLTSGMQRLVSRTSAATTRIAADFQVRSLEVVGCAANPTMTRIRPAIVDVGGFNDGTSSRPGDATGDHFVRVLANQEGVNPDRWDELRVQAFLFRCIDAACSNALSTTFDLDMGRVFIGVPFTLRAEWQPEASRFVVGVDDGPGVVLPYAPALAAGAMRVPFASVRTQSVNAGCTANATVTDSTVIVRQVRTNPEAIVP
jgi:hypothetical protein